MQTCYADESKVSIAKKKTRLLKPTKRFTPKKVPTAIPHPCPHPDCEGTIQVVADPGEIFENRCPCGSIWLGVVRWLDGEVTVKRIPKPNYE